MAADLADRGHDVWKTRGLRSINAADGFVQLERLLADHAPYGAVIPIDWAHFMRQLPSGADRDFFEALAPAATSLPDIARSADAVKMPERLRELPAALQRQALITQLTERVRLLLGHDNTVPIDTRVPLKEIGLDSLMAVELRNVLVRSGGAPLPTTLLFDYPTLDALSSCLGRIWGLDDRGVPAVEPAVERTPTPDACDIADLSEEDAEALLNAELALATARENS